MSNEKPVLSEEQRREALEKALAKVKPMVEERKKDASVYDRSLRTDRMKLLTRKKKLPKIRLFLCMILLKL